MTRIVAEWWSLSLYSLSVVCERLGDGLKASVSYGRSDNVVSPDLSSV